MKELLLAPLVGAAILAGALLLLYPVVAFLCAHPAAFVGLCVFVMVYLLSFAVGHAAIFGLTRRNQ